MPARHILTSLLVALALVSCGGGAGGTSPSLLSIAVSPTNPAIAAPGAMQQFTATGTFSDSSSRDITTSVTWSSASPAVATVSNAANSNGLATSVTTGITTITATFGSVSGTTVLTSGTTSSAAFSRPTGIYVLPNTNEGPDLGTGPTLIAQPFVDGWVMRFAWTDIETSPGTYNWLRLDSAIAALQTAGKKLTLSVFPEVVPSDILSQPGVAIYTADTPTGPVTTAVPWDATALLRWQTFCKALGDHQVADASQGGTKVALRDHPALAQVDTQIVGLGGLRDLNSNLVNTSSYTRAGFTTAVLSSIHEMADNFPNKYRYFAFFNMTDTDPSPTPLYQDMLSTLMTEFNSGATPQLGFYQENLGCSTPDKTTASAIYTTKDKTFSMFQMIYAWLNPPPGYTETSACLVTNSSGMAISGPETAMEYAYNTFGTRYFEVYRADLENTGFTDKFTALHAILFP